jgi:hypothetical protein
MNNNYLSTFILCLAFQYTHGQAEFSTSLKNMNVNGSVRTIKEKSYYTKYKNGAYKKTDLVNSTVYNFNEKGNLLDETIDLTDSWNKEKTNIKVIHTYDNNGNLAERNTSKNGNPTGKISYGYNDKGINTGYTDFFSDGTIQGKHDYKINEKGLKTEVLWYVRGGTTLENKQYYTYDEKGNQLECTTYNKDGKIYSRRYFKYDDSGKQAEMKYFIDQKQIEHNTYKYDQTGNMIQLFQYYENGNVYSKNVYAYEYDKNSNWTKLTHYIDGEPKIIRERVITYSK